jgi:hypothetical protein
MANQAWDRAVINVRERPLSSDINTAQSQLDRSVRDMLASFFISRISGSSDLSNNPRTGFIGDGLKVRQPAAPGLSVQLAPGLGFMYAPADVPQAVGGVVGLDDLSVYKPLPLLASATISGITAGPAAGFDRYDIVEVKVNRVLGNPLSRDTLDTISGLFVSGNVNKTMGFTLDGSVGVVTSPSLSTAAISYKVGVVAATGGAVEPAVTSGYVKIATIFSNNGNMTTGVTRGNIIDQRLLLHPHGMMPFAASFNVPTGAAAPPTGVLFSGPPGVELVVLKIAQPANFRFEVYIIGGAHSSPRGDMQGSAARFFNAGEFYTLNYVDTNFGNLDSTQVGQLVDANIAGPALAFAVGTPFMSTEFYVSRQAAGVTDNAVNNPVGVNIQGFLQRY